MLYKNEAHQKYHVLARGVIISGEFLLVAHCIGMENTFLPGGHVEFREGMRTTLIREMQEEMGLLCEVHEYIGAVEAHFDHEIYHQEVNHLFAARLPHVDQHHNPKSVEKHLEFYWIHRSEMEKHNLQPYPVRELIENYISGVAGPGWLSTLEDE